jgi:hypothetical protein
VSAFIIDYIRVNPWQRSHVFDTEEEDESRTGTDSAIGHPWIELQLSLSMKKKAEPALFRLRCMIIRMLLDLTANLSIRILVRMDVNVGASVLDQLYEVTDRLPGQRTDQVFVHNGSFGDLPAELTLFFRSRE